MREEEEETHREIIKKKEIQPRNFIISKAKKRKTSIGGNEKERERESEIKKKVIDCKKKDLERIK